MKCLNVAMKAKVRHLFKVDSLDQQGDKNTDISFDNGRLANKSMLDVDRTSIVHSNLIKHVTRHDILNGKLA